MTKPTVRQALLGAALFAFSALVYLIQIRLFDAPRDTFFYLFQDVAFVPIQVLFVTLIINRMLNEREKRSRLEKLNMVIGVFFSEVGAWLLTCFSDRDPQIERIRNDLIISSDWPAPQFDDVRRSLKNYRFGIDIEKVDLVLFKDTLVRRRAVLLQLLENPNLLEHESFTELLLAVFHLVDELTCRESVADPPESDRLHIAGDMSRAYGLLVGEWLAYMKHLSESYPYLFSLAMRTNPFDKSASPVMR